MKLLNLSPIKIRMYQEKWIQKGKMNLKYMRYWKQSIVHLHEKMLFWIKKQNQENLWGWNELCVKYIVLSG